MTGSAPDGGLSGIRVKHERPGGSNGSPLRRRLIGNVDLC